MNLNEIPIDIWIQQGVFCLLFVWLLWNQQKDSKEREDKLMSHLSRTTETLEVLSNRMENVSVKVNVIESDLQKLKGE